MAHIRHANLTRWNSESGMERSTLTLLKRAYRSTVTLTVDHETRKVAEFVKRGCAGFGQRCKVLEVGCGHGRYLRILRERGFDVTGVDANPELVRANREAGLGCLTVDEWRGAKDVYDVILMSHVIEHFAPSELVPFMDGYLDRLKVGGALVIATPLFTRFFYDDFDHVRPYNPFGFFMVFGEGSAQVQYYARNKLRVEDIWIRRGYWRFAYRRGRFVPSPTRRVLQLLEFVSAIVFRLSAGLIGQADGWVGLFRKVDSSPAPK